MVPVLSPDKGCDSGRGRKKSFKEKAGTTGR